MTLTVHILSSGHEDGGDELLRNDGTLMPISKALSSRAFYLSLYLPNLLLLAIKPKDRENIFDVAILLFNIPLDIY